MFFKCPIKLLVLISFSFYFVGFAQSDESADAQRLREILMPYFVPVEHDDSFLKNNKEKIDLGRYLFYDQRLSASGTISCNSCHDLQNYGTNGSLYLDARSAGTIFRDVPTIYNSSTLPMFNADGGQDGIIEKIEHALLSPHEMGLEDENNAVSKVEAIAGYKILFESVYNDAISVENIIDALQTFISGLKTPAPIDAFIKGNDKALSKEQIEGGHVFNSKSCYSCHTGSNFGGQMIQKLGIAEEWPNQEDLGYYHVKRLSAYKMFFRVAPLRNVKETNPYFHDSSTNDLWKAVQLMGKHERGLIIDKNDALKIEAFLKSLSGEIPSQYIKEPKVLPNKI